MDCIRKVDLLWQLVELYSSACDSTFKVKMTQSILSVHWAKNLVILT